MARIEHTVEIDRPPAAVFPYLVDPAKVPLWQESLVELRKDGEEPIRAGTGMTEVRTFMGRRIESRLEVVAYEQDRRFDLRTRAGPIPFHVRHTLDPLDGGTRTRLDVAAEAEPRGMLGFAGGLVVRQAKKQFEGDFVRLKALVERA